MTKVCGIIIKNAEGLMTLSMLCFGTAEIIVVSIFAVILVAFITYLCFVPMGNWFIALFSGAYIPTFRLISIKNRKLDVREVVGAYVMAKKSNLPIKLNQIEGVMLSGGNAKNVMSALNLAKFSNLKLTFAQASAIELSSHNVKQVVSDAVNTRVVKIGEIRGFTQDKIEIIAHVNISIKNNLEKFTTGLGLDELKATTSAWILENISKTKNHLDILKEPNKCLLSNLDFRVITFKSMYTVLDVSVTSVERGRDLNAELEVKAIEKEKIYAEIEAERMKHAEELRELKMRTKTEEMKSEILQAEKDIPVAISQAIKEGRFSIMDYYKLMNLQADTALRRAFVNDDDNDEGEF